MRATTPSRLTGLPRPDLGPQVVAAMSAAVVGTAERTVAAVVAEVPEYAGALTREEYRRMLEDGVRTALGGFLGLLAGEPAPGEDPPDGAVPEPAASIVSPGWALRGAYAVGRSEAVAHRSVEALLAAYRVGTGVHWQDLSRIAVEHDVPAGTVAELAALMFAYNDELSAASVAGHADEAAASGRRRAEALERLARSLLAGEPRSVLVHQARTAEWPEPHTLTAVLLPPSQARMTGLGRPGSLSLPADAGTPLPHEETVLLVPDAHLTRTALLASLAGRGAIVGPARPWLQVSASYARAVRALGLPRNGPQAVDTERHLVDLVVTADAEALHDLRADALGPLGDLPEPARRRLEETLRSWLLHQGRREAVAADLRVHPQTVRYRMGQVRQRFGERLDDPDTVGALMVALAAPAALTPAPPPDDDGPSGPAPSRRTGSSGSSGR